MTIDLFTPTIPIYEQHPIFKMILNAEYSAEREVINAWAEGFQDRDGKFINEFQNI